MSDARPPDLHQRTVWESDRFSVVRRSYSTAAGAQTDRDTIQHPGAVTILPWIDRDQICLVRNYRIAVQATLWELPAGTLEPGEPPEVTARRELAEETGYRCQQLSKLHEFFMSPGILNERMFLFLATDLTAGPIDLDPGEEIETAVVTWDKALAMADRGEIQDAKSLVGIYFYDRLLRRKE